MNIALLGMGIVGGGAYDIIREHGLDLNVTRVLERKELGALETMRTTRMDDILTDPDIAAVVEAMGGLHPAYEFVLAALRAQKHVVTSNKQLISHYFRELHEAAAENGVQLRYTAAAGGGIPWLYNLKRAGRCDTVLEVRGIINGTTNFILDAMHAQGADFADVLKEAQARGYAEADPAADIDGLDAQRKCVISASLAFGGVVAEDAVPVAGIRSITAADVAYIQKQGRVCKLMIHARRSETGVCAYVEPTLVRPGEPEATVRGNYNYIALVSKNLGRLSFSGQGAGKEATGCTVVQDLLDIRDALPCPTPDLTPLKVCNDQAVHAYYVRRNGKQYITPPIPVQEMHALGADFFAGVMA